MWSLTSEDLQRAKEQARRRRAELEDRYAGELRAIEAECAELETLERIASGFAQRHGSAAAAPPAEPAELPETVEQAQPDPAPAADDAVDRKPGSRWRFQLSHRTENADSLA